MVLSVVLPNIKLIFILFIVLIILFMLVIIAMDSYWYYLNINDNFIFLPKFILLSFLNTRENILVLLLFWYNIFNLKISSILVKI